MFAEGGIRLDLLVPGLPDVGAAGTSGGVVLEVLLAAIVGADGFFFLGARVGAGAHAEPEVVPVLGAGAHGPGAVDGYPLAAEGVAVVGGVEGLAAGHAGWEEGFGYWV